MDLIATIRHLRDNGARPRVHPNGFIQLDISDHQRIHYWPIGDLPGPEVKSDMHDHVYSFHSRVLVMDQPEYILEKGTAVITHSTVTPTSAAGISGIGRSPNQKGVIAGVLGGHGGDVYWVKHPDTSIAAYGFWEFELESDEKTPLPIESFWDHLNQDVEY